MPYITPWLCGWEVFWIILLSHFSRVRLCVTPWTAAHQAPPSLGFSRQEHGVGCHFLLQCMKVKSESEVAQSCRLLATPWTAAHQAPPSMGFSRQEYWSGVPLPSPEKWYRWTYLQNRNIDIENKCMETKGKRRWDELGDWHWPIYIAW